MGAIDIFLIIAVIILLLICAFFIYKYISLRIKIKKLNQNIEDYLENGNLTPFSTSESEFSILQNSVCDLENNVELQKHNTVMQEKKNSDFIADISHQLKTPIAGLRLYVELDKDIAPSPHTEKEIQLLDKMENLIAKLLRLEKLRTDEYTMDFAEHNVNLIFKTIIGDFKPIFPQKQFKLTGECDLRCDSAWLQEAFANVIKNACEHTTDDGIIDIEILDSEKSVLITITDNGGGVDKDELPKLFNRFHRTKNAKPQSAGIGLAITKTIVEKHHGTVSAENTEQGLCVIICIPKIDGIITI